MPSVRSRLINATTRLGVRLAYRSPGEVTDERQRFAKTDERARKPLPAGYRLEEVEAPVPGRWLHRSGAHRTILYLHGGAFVMRMPNSHTALAARLADDLAASAFLPWYRLAPEHPFPAAPQDCLAAYRMLLESTPASDIVVMGDSAGGNLALSLLHLITSEGLPMPAAVVALSPITDFAQISASWRLNKWRDPMYIVQGVVHPQRHYLQGASPVEPVASPYYGDLSGFPPILVVVGGVEAMLDDAVGFVHKAVESGVRATLHVWKGMPHVFMLNTIVPEALVAQAQVVRWVEKVTADGDAPPPEELAYRSCVELFDQQGLTGRLRSETNDVYLVGP